MEAAPLLSFACFCERVLQEKDGVLSLIRVIDTVFIPALETKEKPDALHTLTLVVGFKSGGFKGEFTAKLSVVSPNGEKLPDFSFPMKLEGGKHGANMIVNAGFAFREEGTYWFELYCNDNPVTRIPLDILVSPAPRMAEASQIPQPQGKPST